MSKENLEILRRGFDGFNRGDREAMVADFAPDFEYVPTGAIPGETGVYRGPEGWIEFVGWMRSEFEGARVEIRELIDAEDQVLAALTLHGRGRQSGVDTSWDIWQLWTVQHGEVVHGQAFVSQAEALEAAGLSSGRA